MAKCKRCKGLKFFICIDPDVDGTPLRCSRCKGTGIEPKDKKEVADKERGVFIKPTPAQHRKVAEVIKNKDNPYLKYRNPDPRCKYPFTPDPLNYCWGYAEKVDEGASKKEIEQFCEGCEYWKGRK